jgi:tRNA pseudouridine13 synthase
MSRARAIAQSAKSHGLPNFYGVQRFGINGDNAQQGREVLLGRGGHERWTRRFLLSAYQASLFNTWLAERMGHGWFERVLTGDIAKKSDTGGLFEVEDAGVEYPRFQRGEITYTGPIYGSRMWWAKDEPGELERAVFEAAGLTKAILRRARLDGSRRRARLLLDDLRMEPHPSGLLFTFSLPKGAYATTVMREFMKSDLAVSPEELG